MIKAQADAKNVMLVTMAVTVRRCVPLSVRINVIEQLENARIVRMVNGAANARTTVEKAVTIQVAIVKHVMRRPVNANVKWDTTVIVVIRSVEEDATQLKSTA